MKLFKSTLTRYHSDVADPGTRCAMKNRRSELLKIFAVSGPIPGTLGAGGACIGGVGSGAGVSGDGAVVLLSSGNLAA